MTFWPISEGSSTTIPAKIINETPFSKPYSVIHFWWHPHNLGNNINNNFFRLEEILEIFSNFLSKNIICSKNMADYAK